MGVPPPGSGFTCVGVKKGFWVLAALFYPASLRSVLGWGFAGAGWATQSTSPLFDRKPPSWGVWCGYGLPCS